MQTNTVEPVSPDELIETNERLAAAAPRAILEWAVERFHPRLTMATAFGAEGCVLLTCWRRSSRRVRVFNLDTGYQFAETLALPRPDRRAIRDRGRAGSAGHDGGGV